ncbi:hypothetical protein ACNKXS_15195, partial [Christiangramia marina]|uniref:hypothetical protein n=1 Tax=Christiangramia marina TaxID=409436 RepID=UPI003AA927A6
KDFLASLAPDLILTMWQAGADAAGLPPSIPHALGVADSAAALAARPPQQALLRQAALVLAPDADAAHRLGAALSPVPACDICADDLPALGRAMRRTPLPPPLPARAR